MMKRWIPIAVILMFFSIVLFSCNLPTGKSTSEASTYVAQGIAATLTARVVQTSTSQALITPSLTPSFTPTITLTPEPSLTPTQGKPWLEITQNSNCRIGPANFYRLITTIQKGTRVQILGRDSFNEYYYVQNPEENSPACWIWSNYATVEGDTSRVPVYTAIPTNTPTFTPTLPPGVSVSYGSVTSCGSEYMLRLYVRNTGSLTWKSIKISIKDNTTGSSFSHELDLFRSYQGCTIDSSQQDLMAGEEGYVSNYDPGQFGYDPTGHNLSVGVTVYSEDGRTGTSASYSFSVTP